MLNDNQSKRPFEADARLGSVPKGPVDHLALERFEKSEKFGRTLQEINHLLGSDLPFEKLLEFIFSALGQIIPYDRLGIALNEDNDSRIRLLWAKSKLPFSALRKNYFAPLKGSTLEKIISSGKPRIIYDLEIYLQLHPASESTRLAIADGIHSSLTCPLRADGKPIGVVFFSSHEPNAYDEEHAELFMAVADQLSVVIEHARLKNYFLPDVADNRPITKTVHELRTQLDTNARYLANQAQDKFADVAPETKALLLAFSQKNSEMVSLLEEISRIENIGKYSL